MSKFCKFIEELKNNSISGFRCVHEKIKDDEAKLIFNALKYNTSLTLLEIMGCSIGYDFGRYLADCLLHNTTLLYLNLSSNSMGVNNARYIAKTLDFRNPQHNSTLLTLNISDNNLGNEGFGCFAEALVHNNTLNVINLVYNKIDNDGAKHIIRIIQHNSTLTDINISLNPIFDIFELKLVVDALKNNSTLLNLLFNSKLLNKHNVIEYRIADLLKRNMKNKESRETTLFSSFYALLILK